jgi:hypothetical protein
MFRLKIAALLVCLHVLIVVSADAVEEDTAWLTRGKWEFGLWSGGGMTFSRDTQMFISGFRGAKALTSKIQYAFEVVPVFVIFQKETVYGADITPFLLKWNFKGTNNKVFPYILGGAGTLFSGSDVPEGTSHFNFTPQGGFGVHLSTQEKRAIAFELRFVHISNGGFESPNPGINSLQLHVGYSWLN